MAELAREFEEALRLLREGDLAAARKAAAAMVAREPGRPEGHHLEGLVALERRDMDRAEEAVSKAAAIDPARVSARLDLARIHVQMRRLDAAMDDASHALYLEPESAQAYLQMGVVYRMQEEYDEAVRCLKSAIALDPRLLEAYSELGWIYQKHDNLHLAMDMYENALEIDPENVDAQHQLGFLFVRCEQYAKGVALFEKACAATKPSALIPRLNLANAYYHTGRPDLAMRLYDQILAQEPHYYNARWNRAHLRLAEHDFERGWTDYEYRYFLDDLWTPRLFPFPPWRGEPLEGKTLLVIAEQGLGDQIMFASCVPDLIGRAQRLVLECNHRLGALFRRAFPEVEVMADRHEARPDWLASVGHVDYQVYMGSLPGLLRRRAGDFPRHSGYLRADPARVAYWRARLAELGHGRPIGLSWRGGTASTRRSMRSLELEQLLPLLAVPGCRFVSLQYGKVADEVAAFNRAHGASIAHWEEAIEDYDETAALCTALDLTVSVCTSVIHLNGALGRPVWVLVPAVPEWRYGAAGERMPWYPSAKLFRAAEIDGWEAVVAAVAAELQAQG